MAVGRSWRLGVVMCSCFFSLAKLLLFAFLFWACFWKKSPKTQKRSFRRILFPSCFRPDFRKSGRKRISSRRVERILRPSLLKRLDNSSSATFADKSRGAFANFCQGNLIPLLVLITFCFQNLRSVFSFHFLRIAEWPATSHVYNCT